MLQIASNTWESKNGTVQHMPGLKNSLLQKAPERRILQRQAPEPLQEEKPRRLMTQVDNFDEVLRKLTQDITTLKAHVLNRENVYDGPEPAVQRFYRGRTDQLDPVDRQRRDDRQSRTVTRSRNDANERYTNRSTDRQYQRTGNQRTDRGRDNTRTANFDSHTAGRCF